MGDELKPCPCGDKAQKPYEIHAGGVPWWVIDCAALGCGWSLEAGTKAEAIERWNTRTETQSQATIDELVGALNGMLRIVLPIDMGLAQAECVDEPVPDDKTVLSFMGSGASDRVTAGEYRAAVSDARQALLLARKGEGE